MCFNTATERASPSPGAKGAGPMGAFKIACHLIQFEELVDIACPAS